LGRDQLDGKPFGHGHSSDGFLGGIRLVRRLVLAVWDDLLSNARRRRCQREKAKHEELSPAYHDESTRRYRGFGGTKLCRWPLSSYPWATHQVALGGERGASAT